MISLLITCLMMPTPYAPPAHTIELGGMTALITAQGTNWHIRLEAPTKGWVGIGFNTKASMTGTHLLLGRIKSQPAEMNEYHVYGPGDPRLVQEIGAAATVQQLAGQESGSTTTLEFTLPMKAADRWHHDLSEGKKLYIWLAYSVSDDWSHHSRMRQGTWLTF
ncbi:MAG: DOMON domain-containing protein [Bacteroidota bacterium]